jgi:phosphoadenosine phosphosulfate reductase
MTAQGLLPEIQELQVRYENAYPQEVLRWASQTFAEGLVVVTSFQPTGIVTLHMLQELGIHANVLTLDTDLLFPETYRLMDEIEQRFHHNIIRVRPAQTLDQQAQEYGDSLWTHNPDQCCNIRKTLPLHKALTGSNYQAWITGLRRDQSDQRTVTPVVSWDRRYNMIKLCPFATWSEDMIWTYIHAYELPYNTLHDQGYPSIGCYPCTKAVASGADVRSGRWANHAKTECGIHVEVQQSAVSCNG